MFDRDKGKKRTMMDFLNSTPCQFGRWAIPLALNGQGLVGLVSEHSEFDEQARSACVEWCRQAKANLNSIEEQLNAEYGLPELEMLRVEACFCIIQGHWQGTVCLTNILLEAFLKLALVYANTKAPQAMAQPLSRIMGSLSGPVQKFMKMMLNDTINAAREQKLIDDETQSVLHDFRKRFRNAFFHADMHSMFSDQTTPVTGVDLDQYEIEHDDVAIWSLPLLLGEALWQNAEANVIPYFHYVDKLIRETLPKIFPNIT